MTARKLLDDCFLHDKDRLRHRDVLRLLDERLSGICEPERVPLAQMLGRVLAERLTAGLNVPPGDNAAVDGYAFRHADYVASGGRLMVAMRIPAGAFPDEVLAEGYGARIFTGALMPEGADTVAMQEDCQADGDQVVIPAGLKPGANRRRAGEDTAIGDQIAAPGLILRAADLGALASQGIVDAACYRELRIAVFSTGDELADPGTPLKRGQIHDSNRSMLLALLERWPGDATDCGRLPDRPDRVRNALLEASASFDLIVTSGGASRGEEDHIVTVLDEIGKRHIWQLAIKPGRPLTVGQIGDTPFFGLPGNPVAVFVCALLYLRPAVHLLQGALPDDPAGYMLPASFSMKKKPDRREFLRGMAVREGGVVVGVDKFGRDGSGIISGLRAADGLIEIAEDVTAIKIGDPVLFRPFFAYGLG